MKNIPGFIILFSSCPSLYVFTAADTCYFPNHEKTSGSGVEFVKCNDNDLSSACCDAVHSKCADIGNGLCFDGKVLFREACADQWWNSSSCPQHCVDGWCSCPKHRKIRL